MSCKTTVYTVKGSDDRLWGVFSSEEMACRYIRQEWPEARPMEDCYGAWWFPEFDRGWSFIVESLDVDAGINEEARP